MPEISHLELPVPAPPAYSNLLGAASQRGRAYIERAFDGSFTCSLSASVNLASAVSSPREVFSTILILDLCRALLSPQLESRAVQALLAAMRPDGWLHFFENRDLLPADADCTALGVAALCSRGALSVERTQSILHAILTNTTRAGVIRVYTDACPRRAEVVDAAVIANVLYAASTVGYSLDTEASEALLLSTLLDRRYLSGTRYYHCPETFLLFASRLLVADPHRYQYLRHPLIGALAARAGVQKTALGIAQWAAAAQLLVVLPEEVEQCRQRLLFKQTASGAWPAEALFKYGRKNLYFGSAALSTAFAIHSLVGITASRSSQLASSDAEPPESQVVKKTTRRFRSSGFWNTSSTSVQGAIEDDLVPLINATRLRQG